MTELQTALLELAERGSPAGSVAVTQRAIDAAMRSRVRKRRRPVVLSAAAVVIALSVAASALYVREKTDDVDRVDLTGVLASPDAGSAEAMNVLVVGTDDNSRGDAIALVRIARAQGVVSVLSIPRDLSVGGERINAAATDPRRLVDIVRQETGLPVDHYVEIDGVGFRRTIDALGGVTLNLGTPVRDRLSGLDLPAGCPRLDGEQALAWVRSRHLESYEDGRWGADPTGDLGRIQRQQHLALVVLQQLVVARDPRTLSRLLDVAADSVRVDDDFSFARLREWAEKTVEGDGTVALFVLPTTPTVLSNGGAALLLDRAQLSDVARSFNAPRREGTAERQDC